MDVHQQSACSVLVEPLCSSRIQVMHRVGQNQVLRMGILKLKDVFKDSVDVNLVVSFFSSLQHLVSLMVAGSTSAVFYFTLCSEASENISSSISER